MSAAGRAGSRRRALLEVAALFGRLGVTGFGGPAAHVALMERECVRDRQWITREHFLALLGVANLIPGPTSTELAMHIGRLRAGWPGLIVAGLAFIAPAALIVGVLAAVYVRTGDLPVLQHVLGAVRPVVLVVILDAWVRLAGAAIRSVWTVAVALGSICAVLAGIPEVVVLVGGGVACLVIRRWSALVALLSATAVAGLSAAAPAAVRTSEVFSYFAGVGSLLFGSGYVLVSVLQGDLVDQRGWLTSRQLLDAIAVGQATPGPVFTTATFVGYLIGGARMAVVATVAIFLPAFVFSACAAAAFDTLRRSTLAQGFIAGVNAAAVALIGIVLVDLGRVVLTEVTSAALTVVAAALLFAGRITSTRLLLAAALFGLARSFF